MERLKRPATKRPAGAAPNKRPGPSRGPRPKSDSSDKPRFRGRDEAPPKRGPRREDAPARGARPERPAFRGRAEGPPSTARRPERPAFRGRDEGPSSASRGRPARPAFRGRNEGVAAGRDQDEAPRRGFVEGPRGLRHRSFDANPDLESFDDDTYGETPAAPERRAFSTWEGPVVTSGDRALAGPLRSLFDLDPEQNRSLTHGFHPYAARMPPSLARQAVALWSKPGDTVFDPFTGSGTVLVEAYAQGRKSFGIDASPLAVLIATTRSTLLSREDGAALMAAGQQISLESEERAKGRKKMAGISPWARKEHDNFHPHVFLELYGLRSLIFAWKGPEPLSRALQLCLSSMLGKFMRQGEGAPRDGHVKRIGRGVPSNFFGRRVAELVSQLADLGAQVPDRTPAPKVSEGDARECKPAKTASAQLVLTSPPYAGTYDYGNIHSSRFAWLGIDPRPLFLKQVGARARGLGAEPGAWERSRHAWLSQMSRVLVPGGHAIIVVGDGVVGNEAENAQSAIWAAAPAAGLEPLAFASQLRPSHDRRIRDIFGDRPRSEHVLVLRKPGR